MSILRLKVMTMECRAGSDGDITTAVREAASLSFQKRCVVEFEHNGILVIVDTEAWLNSILEKWNADLDLPDPTAD